MHQQFSKISASLFAIFGIFAVGLIDFATGIEIRAFPLYFFPLMVAAWYLGKIASFTLSVLAAIVWVIIAMYFGGREYSQSYIWVVNFFTQLSTFTLVSLIIVSLNQALTKERILSRTDNLTGLLNRGAFYEHSQILLNLCRRHKRSITFAYIDLDNFKNANDTLGHHHGDLILSKVGSVLKQNLRSSDVAGRMGGDEFVVLLPELSPTNARKVLENIRIRIEEVPELMACNVTPSIGVISYIEAPTELVEKLIKTADELMYRAKKTGKNHIVAEYF